MDRKQKVARAHARKLIYKVRVVITKNLCIREWSINSSCGVLWNTVLSGDLFYFIFATIVVANYRDANVCFGSLDSYMIQIYNIY